MTRREFAVRVVVATLLMGFSPSAAQAQYLDPGAGSIILQVVIAAVVGVAATVRLYWARISVFFSRRSKGPDGR